MAQDKIPRNRRDLANILRLKDTKIPETVDEAVFILNVEEDLRGSVTTYVKIVTQKKIKKSAENTTSIEIAALLLPLIANEEDNRPVAKVVAKDSKR